MERIDLALLIQIFKGFKSTLPRPAPQDLPIFAERGKTCFFRGAGQPFPLGGAHIPDQNHHCCLQSHRQSNQPVLLWPGAIRSATARLITPIPDQADEEMSSKGSFSSDKEILENKYDHDDDGDTCTD